MRKCKNCTTCSGMCMNTWEPLGDDGQVSIWLAVLAIVAVVLTGAFLWL